MDFLDLFVFPHAEQLEMFYLNLSEIIFCLRLTKHKGSNDRVLASIFNKNATIGLYLVAGHVAYPTQTTCMQGRNILNGVVILHETIHNLHQKKLNGQY
jgi:hypothetical protein